MKNRRHPKGKDRSSRSTFADSMTASQICGIHDLAWANPNLIHLEVDEPDFATPHNVVRAARRATFRPHMMLFNRKMLGGEFT